MKAVQFTLAAALVCVTAFTIVGFATSCKTTLPPDPDVTIVVSPDAHPPLIDAADPCASACDNLTALGCSGGTDPDCVATCRHALAEHITKLDTMCLTSAHSKTEARQCAGGACK